MQTPRIRRAGIDDMATLDAGLRALSADLGHTHRAGVAELADAALAPHPPFVPDPSDEVIPNIHPNRNMGERPRATVGLAGYHQADTACPITPDTWSAAYASAQTAVHAARLVLAGEPHAYALCRPSGHHAYGDMAGGFCYLNNARSRRKTCAGNAAALRSSTSMSTPATARRASSMTAPTCSSPPSTPIRRTIIRSMPAMPTSAGSGPASATR
jgi:hypothetical protein